MTVIHYASNVALLAYAAASVLYLLSVQRPAQSGGWAAHAAFGLFVAGTLAVTAAAVDALMDGAPGVSFLQLSGLLLTSAIGWLAVLGHWQFKLRLIGAFVAPLATLILLLQFFITPAGVDHAQSINSTSSGFLVGTHVVMAVLGQAFAIIACAVSVVYLWLQSLLKRKMLSQLPANLPAIDRIDFLLRLSLWTGFLFITLGLLSGAVYTQFYAPAIDLRLRAKVIWATAVWLWYLATLLARNVFNKPSKRIAQMSLGGFLLLALSYFGMGFFRSGGG